MFAQDAWGGAYEDEAAQIGPIADLFGRVRELLVSAEGLPVQRERLLVLVASNKRWDVCQWVPMDGRTWQTLNPPRAEVLTHPIEAAINALPGDGASGLRPWVATTVRLGWQAQGQVRATERGPSVDNLPAVPAIYRFRFVGMEGGSVYVGETMNLARRMGNYRVGDPHLRTNAWVHDLMVTHLASGSVLELDVAFGASATTDGVTRELLLGDKLDRVLAEAAAIHDVPRSVLLNKR